MARSRGPIYVADNSPTAINDALQQLLSMIDQLSGEHDDTTISVGPHTHDADDPDSGGPIDVPAADIDHDDLLNVTTDQHHAKLHETLHREGGADELKLDDVGAPDDNTDLNASTTAHGLMQKYPNNASLFLDGTGTFSAVVATSDEATDIENVEGDATSPIWEEVQVTRNLGVEILANGSAMRLDTNLGIWLPDAAPLTAGADDDEFADASGGVPSGWTEVDHDGNTVVSEDSAGLLMVKATAGGNNNSGIYKAIPAGNFTIWAKIDVGGLTFTNATAGLAIWEDAASTTARLINFRIYMGTTNASFDVDLWTDYNSFSSTLFGPSVLHTGSHPPGPCYLRIRRTTATYAFDISRDGLSWARVYSNTISFTPAHYGIFVDNVVTTGDAYARAQFFRYVASDVGINGLVSGRRV